MDKNRKPALFIKKPDMRLIELGALEKPIWKVFRWQKRQ